MPVRKDDGTHLDSLAHCPLDRKPPTVNFRRNAFNYDAFSPIGRQLQAILPARNMPFNWLLESGLPARRPVGLSRYIARLMRTVES